MKSATKPETPSPINIVLFGEPGVGKSSVINLIAGRPIAKVSANVDGCTTKYDIPFDNASYTVYEAVGLEEYQIDANRYYNAIEKACSLIRSLTNAGGIHLLLFCLRGDRIAATVERNYRLFHDLLCDKRVPIALIFTGLEREQRMEDWWARNEGTIKKYGIHSVAHACITAFPDPVDPVQAAKYQESRYAVLELISECTKDGPMVTDVAKNVAKSSSTSAPPASSPAPPASSSPAALSISHTSAPPPSFASSNPVMKSATKRETLSSVNIVIFGGTGVGKSSVVNLIAGCPIANVSSDVDRCTMASTKYDIPIDNASYTVYDTVGLEEPEMDVNGYCDTIEKASSLICSLKNAGGIHLLLFCLRRGRITTTVKSNYTLFCESLCDKRVPVALVITGLEGEQRMEDWWSRNHGSIEKYGIHSVAHACITAVQDLDKPGQVAKYEESRNTVLELISKCTKDGPMVTDVAKNVAKSSSTSVPPASSSVPPTSSSPPALPISSAPPGSVISASPAPAPPASNTSAPPPSLTSSNSVQRETPFPINIVLFGETGVGKSFVINLIAGSPIAKVSADVDGCTMASTRYIIPVDNQLYTVYETVGLDEPQMGVNGYYAAIEKAYHLIQSLADAGGIHLLLFCLRGDLITPTIQSNYRLFHEFLCEKRVPIVLVITGLEKEQRMENWWSRNEGNVKKYGIRSVAHACITAVQDLDDPGRAAKYEESRKIVLDLLSKCTKDGPVLMDKEKSIATLIALMAALVSNKFRPKRRDYTRVLVKRCGMEPDTAKKVSQLIESSRT